jgi:hypothetical protein
LEERTLADGQGLMIITLLTDFGTADSYVWSSRPVAVEAPDLSRAELRLRG